MWETDGIYNKARELVEAESELSPGQIAERLFESARQTMDEHVRKNHN
ncbi:MAG: hypothetical protein R3D26_10065 [Cyanobacteriota/Melainabacteria group bacterium]